MFLLVLPLLLQPLQLILLLLGVRTASTASCLLPVLQRFFVFEFLVIIFSVMVQCGRFSGLLSALHRTIKFIFYIVSYLLSYYYSVNLLTHY